MDVVRVDGDLVTVWLDCMVVQATLTNEQVRKLTTGELMVWFQLWGELKPHDEETRWLTFEDILNGYYDRLRGAYRSSQRDSEPTVSMKGAQENETVQEA